MFFEKCYTITSDRVREKCMESKRERIKKTHKYAITPPSESDGRWRTNFTGKDGIRKTIRAKTEEEILDKLVELYSCEENLDNRTFNDLFEEWILYKGNFVNSNNTIVRHRQRYEKYFSRSRLVNRKLNRIDGFLLEEECNRIVRDYNLSRKEWVNTKAILNGMYDYAKRMNYITVNPMPDVKIAVKYRQVNKKTGRTQTYNTEEQKALFDYLDKLYAETGDVALMAVKLNFTMGLRVAELVALKWSDIEGNQIHVVREEVRDQPHNTSTVAEHTKTNSDRFVFLVPDAIRILEKLPHDGEYIFTRDGRRLTSRKINYVLEKYAERNGLETKSSHKIRKTYASRLNAKGVPMDLIREQLGHTSLETTYSYIFNPLTETESYKAVTEAVRFSTPEDGIHPPMVTNISGLRRKKETSNGSCPQLYPTFLSKQKS